MFRRFTSSLLVTSLCFCATSSLCATELSLDEAFQLSIKNAPEIQLARLQIEGASAQKDEARSKLFPQASIFGQWSKNELSYEFPYTEDQKLVEILDDKSDQPLSEGTRVRVRYVYLEKVDPNFSG